MLNCRKDHLQIFHLNLMPAYGHHLIYRHLIFMDIIIEGPQLPGPPPPLAMPLFLYLLVCRGGTIAKNGRVFTLMALTNKRQF